MDPTMPVTVSSNFIGYGSDKHNHLLLPLTRDLCTKHYSCLPACKSKWEENHQHDSQIKTAEKEETRGNTSFNKWQNTARKKGERERGKGEGRERWALNNNLLSWKCINTEIMRCWKCQNIFQNSNFMKSNDQRENSETSIKNLFEVLDKKVTKSI